MGLSIYGDSSYDDEIASEEKEDDDEVVGSFEDVPASSQLEPHHDSFTERTKARRIQRERPPLASLQVRFENPQHWALSKPIISVCFPKVGSSAIFSFFRCNGLPSQHWICYGRCIGRPS
jgi:hypothetical protein